MTEAAVNVFLTEFEDGLLGYDLRVQHEEATVADFLSALTAFAEAHLADCKGCDGCCWERAPLTAPDVAGLAALLPDGGQPYPAQAVCRAFGTVRFDQNGIIDIMLKRDEESACGFLDRAGKFCRAWAARPFVCRSHFCLAKSARLQALREEVANRGENELTRLLLAEERGGAPPWITEKLDPADFPPESGFETLDWRQIRIREITPPQLWQELTAE